MFERIDDFLKSQEVSLEFDQSGEPTDNDLQIATVVLLLEMANIDGDFPSEEVTSLVRTMNRVFLLSDEEVGYFVQVANELRKQPGKVDSCIEAINSHFGRRTAIVDPLQRLEADSCRFASRTSRSAICLRAPYSSWIIP